MPSEIPARSGLIAVAVEPKSKSDRERLGAALAELAAGDASFDVSTDQSSGQTMLRGVSELHLDDKIGALRNSYKIDINVGAPQVAFVERLIRRAQADDAPIRSATSWICGAGGFRVATSRGRCLRHHRAGAAHEHVWICGRVARDQPGASQLYHAVRPLCAGILARRRSALRIRGGNAHLTRDVCKQPITCRHCNLTVFSLISLWVLSLRGRECRGVVQPCR